jgi:sarcosine oxidase subunit gamma
MADPAALPLAPRSPLGAASSDPFPIVRAASVEIDERPFLAQILLRMPPVDDAIAVVGAALDLDLPPPGRLARAPGAFRLAIWMGPDEWLVVEPGAPEAVADRLLAAGRAHGATTVDVSAHRTLLELRGTAVRDVLSAGCSIDLHPWSFPIGSAVQTLLARVDVIIGRGGEDVWHVAVRSSFATYLASWLQDAVEE